MRIYRPCAIGFLTIALAFLAVGQQRTGEAGVFDHYLLTLSWSPEFCYTNPANPECAPGQHHGFIVHGLWPESRGGGGPEYCSHSPGLADPARMLDLMPDLRLIEHEWLAHGTCSGINAAAYFGQLRKAFESVPDSEAVRRSASSVRDHALRHQKRIRRGESRIKCRRARDRMPQNISHSGRDLPLEELAPDPLPCPPRLHGKNRPRSAGAVTGLYCFTAPKC